MPYKNKDAENAYRREYMREYKRKQRENVAGTITITVKKSDAEFYDALGDAAFFFDISMPEFLCRCAYEKLCEGRYLKKEEYEKKFLKY